VNPLHPNRDGLRSRPTITGHQWTFDDGLLPGQGFEIVTMPSQTSIPEEEVIVKQCGIRARSVSVLVEILDLDSTSRITRTWEGIKLIHEVEMPYLPGLESIFTPGSRITKPVTLIEPASFQKPISIVPQLNDTGNSCSFRLRVNGDLTWRDPELNYVYNLECSKAFLMTKEDVEKHYTDPNYPNEYYYVHTLIPITERLKIEIVFPKGYNPTAYPGVFLGLSEFMHNKELNRVNQGFIKDNERVIFTVEKPYIGFRYFIGWISPSHHEVNSLKANLGTLSPSNATQTVKTAQDACNAL
jgi:hypothetical protein